MKLIPLFALHLAGSIYEIATGQSFTQRLVRRKIGNLFRDVPLRSWQDGRTNRAPMPSPEECQHLNEQAGRSL